MEDCAVDVDKSDLTLKDLITRHGPKAKIVLKEGDREIGRIYLDPQTRRPRPAKRVIGLHRGAVAHMAEDFDAPLPDEFWLGDP